MGLRLRDLLTHFFLASVSRFTPPSTYLIQQSFFLHMRRMLIRPLLTV